MANWWQCAILLAFTAAFGWIVQQGFKPTNSDGVMGHIIQPLYGVWLYVVLAALINRRSLTVNPEYFLLKNGPIPVRGSDKLPRDQIAFCFYFTVVGLTDDGAPFDVQHMSGIQTRQGRQICSFLEHQNRDQAKAGAYEIAQALNAGRSTSLIEVRALSGDRVDPAEERRAWKWAAICGAALLAGILWETAYRWRWI